MSQLVFAQLSYINIMTHGSSKVCREHLKHVALFGNASRIEKKGLYLCHVNSSHNLTLKLMCLIYLE